MVWTQKSCQVGLEAIVSLWSFKDFKETQEQYLNFAMYSSSSVGLLTALAELS